MITAFLGFQMSGSGQFFVGGIDTTPGIIALTSTFDVHAGGIVGVVITGCQRGRAWIILLLQIWSYL